MTTEGDNVSVVYEDIDEEEVRTSRREESGRGERGGAITRPYTLRYIREGILAEIK